MFQRRFLTALCVTSLYVLAEAQQTAYGQCGGQGWTGPTTCVSGYTCTYSNPYYSQCVPSGSGGGSSTVTSSTPAPTSTSPATGSQSYSNPTIWQDLADCEVIRVGDTFYYTASTMHYSPGAPILRSYDLVHWEFAGHSVPTLDWDSKYNLANGQRAYVKGIWASSLRYRKSNGLFYWIGCIEFSKSWVYTAPSVEGPWTRHGPLNTCYYDAGLLIDDNDNIFVAYGSSTINVAQLSSDGFSQVRTQAVYTSPSDIGYIEGSRMYQINGNYYIAVTQPTPGGEYILKSSSGTPWGPYTIKKFVRDVGNPVPGGAGPHQGGIVDTPSGQWYYIGFSDAYPGGRVPVMTPFTWGSDGFPVAQLDSSGKFPTSGTVPLASRPLRSATGTFTFTSPLAPEWEWNHNPDTTKFSISGTALKLSTATVTFDLYSARNTLTRRILGPQSTATIVLDYSGMQNGDRAGLALFRDKSAWIGIKKDNGGARVVFINGIDMDTTWTTTNTGAEAAAGGSIPATGKIWLRLAADIRPSSSSPQGTFSYSTDGSTFTRVGNGYTMNKDWHYFMGYRFAVFNYATSALGGSVLVNSFTLTT